MSDYIYYVINKSEIEKQYAVVYAESETAVRVKLIKMFGSLKPSDIAVHRTKDDLERDGYTMWGTII